MAGSHRCARRRGLSLGYGAALVLALFFLLSQDAGAASRSRFHTVVIDAGHGGFDRGGIPGQRVPEKTMALDVSLRVAKKLRADGYRVVMTRDSDVFVPLGRRCAIANAQSNAIFVCIHFNSATRAGANGIETYYYRQDSAGLAANIHRQVVGKTTSDNRGIRRRGFYVLRRTAIPSVLVECGFLTNPTEARLALQSSYRDRLAEAIAAGVESKPTPFNRPVLAELKRVTPPAGAGASRYNDFVLAQPERHRAISHHRGHSSRRSSSHHKKSSSHSKKKSSSSKTKKKASSSKTKKKKKSDD